MTAEIEKSNLSNLQEPLSLEQAFTIFDMVADNQEIAFGYASDGCYARAHIMCNIYSAMGLSPKKAWMLREKGDQGLRVNRADGSSISWSFHVAPTLSVMTPAGIQDMVIDPGLFDGPVTVGEWATIMGKTGRNVKVAPVGVAPRKDFGSYHCWDNITQKTNDAAKTTMKNYLPKQGVGLRTVFASRSRRKLSDVQAMPQQGQTWMTAGEPIEKENLYETFIIKERLDIFQRKSGWWLRKKGRAYAW